MSNIKPTLALESIASFEMNMAIRAMMKEAICVSLAQLKLMVVRLYIAISRKTDKHEPCLLTSLVKQKLFCKIRDDGMRILTSFAFDLNEKKCSAVL